ncbi:MAG: hypothetical protein L0Y72_25210 [Gemmataceae bacterium]|nr:hypothetical protein [Gemmataceae bacterium]
MKRATILVGLGLSAFLLPQARAGDKKTEDIVKDMLKTMDSITSTLATIKDQESAKAAKTDLRKAADQWNVLKKKAGDIAPPDKGEKDRLAKQYRMKLEEAQKKLFAEVLRVQGVAGGRDALLEIKSVLAKKDKKDDKSKP